LKAIIGTSYHILIFRCVSQFLNDSASQATVVENQSHIFHLSLPLSKLRKGWTLRKMSESRFQVQPQSLKDEVLDFWQVPPF